MIHAVVALRTEASPLAEALELEPSPADEATFPVFEGERGRLVVSGVGRVAAAAATAYLEARHPDEADLWLNVGIAAHRDLPLGTVVVAHKIVERSTERRWYPTLLQEPDLPTLTICTLDRPMAEPRDGAVYEMEASGFVATALRWTTSERIAVVKVVSDHGIERPRRLEPGEVNRLLEQALPAIIAHGESVERLLIERSGTNRSDYLNGVQQRFRFSVTQRRRLDRLANRAAVLELPHEEIDSIGAHSASEFIQRLEERLDAAAEGRR